MYNFTEELRSPLSPLVCSNIDTKSLDSKTRASMEQSIQNEIIYNERRLSYGSSYAERFRAQG